VGLRRESELDSVSVTILTPCPARRRRSHPRGAPLDQGKRWHHYDVSHVTFMPKQMTPEQLFAADWICKKLYAPSRSRWRPYLPAPAASARKFFSSFSTDLG
jgi:hypothetical protein